MTIDPYLVIGLTTVWLLSVGAVCAALTSIADAIKDKK